MSTGTVESAVATVKVETRQMVNAVIASVLGWSLDLFDLFILLFVAPIVGKLFFPSEYATLSLAAVYASFAVTLLMRPFGSALFGSYADRFGRKKAMITAVIGVGISTALFGVLPTVAQVGVIAPIIFLILRLVQGLFVGGVVASTHTIGTESLPARWRGLMSGTIGGGGAGIGALIASLVYWVTSEAFPGEAYNVWGWRCMFFSGLLSAILGVFIFNNLEESPIWAALKAQRAARGQGEVVRAPLHDVFSRQYLPILLVNLLLTFGGGAGYYLTSGMLPTLFRVVNGIPSTDASVILIESSFAVIIVCMTVGHISTLWGRKKTLMTMAVLRLIGIPLCFLAMGSTKDVGTITAYALVLTFLGNGGYAPLLVFLNERFPTAIRSTGTGLSWNIGFALGGMMPTLVSLFSSTPQDLPTVLAIFTAVISVLFLIGTIIIPETKNRFE